MLTRSLWQIWCVRGMTRSLEFRLDDRDQVTELRLDDQPTDAAGIEGARKAGLLTIPLGTPLRPDAPPRRLVMKTRRSYSKAAAHRIAFGGFPLLHAREQSGAIGVTQSPNLWISPAVSRGLRRIETGGLPADLRERPSTRLAFEFVEQPFLLQLDVEASPPLVRTRSQTVFRIDATRPGARRPSSPNGFAASSSRSSSTSGRGSSSSPWARTTWSRDGASAESQTAGLGARGAGAEDRPDFPGTRTDEGESPAQGISADSPRRPGEARPVRPRRRDVRRHLLRAVRRSQPRDGAR